MRPMQKTNRLALTAGLFFCLLLLPCFTREFSEQKAVVFPFLNKIFSYSPEKQALRVLYQAETFFTRYFNRDGKYLWLSSTLKSGVKQLSYYSITENTLTPVYTGECQQVIPLQGICLVIGNIFQPGKGFRYDVYRLAEQKLSETPVYSVYLDLFLSDIEWIDGSVLVAGADKADQKNALYWLDLEQTRTRLLFSRPKSGDFFKLIQADHSLFIYTSLQNWRARPSFICWEFSLPDLADREVVPPPQETCITEFPGKYAPFGKGFVDQHALFIPVIDKQYNTGVLQLTGLHNQTRARFFALPTGLYLELPATGAGPLHYFIGYNYYQAKHDFWFLQLPGDFSERAIKDPVQLKLEY